MGSPLEREARGWEAYCSEKLEDGRPLSFGPLSLSKVWEQGRRKGQIGYKLTPKISKVAHSNDQEPGEKSIRALARKRNGENGGTWFRRKNHVVIPVLDLVPPKKPCVFCS